MLVAFFSTNRVPPPPPRERAKRQQTRDEKEYQAQKKEHHELEAARRASLIDEEVCQLRAIELAAGLLAPELMRLTGALMLVLLLLRVSRLPIK